MSRTISVEIVASIEKLTQGLKQAGALQAEMVVL